MLNWWPNANATKSGAGAQPAREKEPGAERKRSQAPALRILRAPAGVAVYYGLEQEVEIHTP